MARGDDIDLESFLNDLKEDPKFKKFRLILKNTRERMKIERDRNRTSRAMHGRKQFSPKALMEATANDLSARARLVEIRVRATIHMDLLEDACDALRNHVYTEYHEEVRKYGSAEQRKALIERVQGTARTFIVEGQALIDMLDQIIKDIDAASFHLRNMMETMKLLDGTKGKVI
jgi:hypothetical protein